MALNILLMVLMCVSMLQEVGTSTLSPKTPWRLPTTLPLSPTTLPRTTTTLSLAPTTLTLDPTTLPRTTTTLSLAPTTLTLDPTTMPHTTPPVCITVSGRRLMPGESSDEGCRFCFCDMYDGLTCYYHHCDPAMCVDAVPIYVGCECYWCPSGDNCKIPETGEVIPSGEPVIRNGMECSCPPQSYTFPGTWEEENYIAICVPVSTLPPTTPPTPPSTSTPQLDCITDSGRQLMPGETWTENCQFCTCDTVDGILCYYIDCLPPMCVDAVQSYAGCPYCYNCPNGDNCKIPATGEVIPSGDPVILKGMECRCPPQSDSLPGTWEENNYIAICVPVSTLPPTTTPTPLPTTTQKKNKKSRKSKKARKIASRTKARIIASRTKARKIASLTKARKIASRTKARNIARLTKTT